MKARPRFFTGLKPKKTMQDEGSTTQPEEVHLDLDKPVETQVADAGPVDPATFAEATQAPAEEGQHEAVEAETEQKKTETEPEATGVKPGFNCQACKGEGLKDQSTICPNCNGTGKVA